MTNPPISEGRYVAEVMGIAKIHMRVLPQIRCMTRTWGSFFIDQAGKSYSSIGAIVYLALVAAGKKTLRVSVLFIVNRVDTRMIVLFYKHAFVVLQQ